MFIRDVCLALQKAKVPYALVGGYAVALHGIVRGTVDVDIVIKWTLANLKNAENTLKSIGLVSRIPVDAHSVFHFRDEYVQKRNLIAWNFYHPRNPAQQVDIIITYDLREAHSKSIVTSFGKAHILSRKDLIEMKRASGRPQDLEDVKALEST